MHSFTGLMLALLVATVRGQNFSVPTGWRKPSSTRPRSERLSNAQTVVGTLISAVNSSDGSTNPAMDIWAHANVPAGLAQHDYISGSRDNHNLVSSIIAGFRSAHDPSYFDNTQPLKDVTSDALIWGLAAFYGARAYNDSNLLDIAAGVWNVGQAYAVSAQDAASGTHHSRNVSFPVDCIPNVTSVGAVFWQAFNLGGLGCNGETVGAYVALSAHLWEATGNTTYLDAAEKSADFMYNHMYSQSDQIIVDSYNIGTCGSNNLSLTYNQGFLLEGLSILSSTPVSDNSTWSSLLQTLVVSTVHSPQWTISSGDNAGVLTETDSGDPTKFHESWIFRNAFTRALYEVWSRTSPSSPMAELIQAFMLVQYNALLDLASNEGDFYSPIWTGPSLQTRVPWGQLSALEVLNAVLNMPPANASSSSTGTLAPPTATSRPSTVSTRTSRTLSGGAIAGIVVGAIAGALGALIGVGLLTRRNKRDKAEQSDLGEVDPFPPGLPVIQRRVELPFANHNGKIRDGYGFGPSLSSGSGPTASSSRSAASETAPVLASADLPARPEPEHPFAELTRAIRQLRLNLNLRDAPPSYYTGPE
ncbi:hypothetical protein PENSPDRAFT_493749 [Peniophora sp. CONT]|nr:hypothetical protein PENSPDRAFT_493749 [Peniophora sp. CONT]